MNQIDQIAPALPGEVKWAKRLVYIMDEVYTVPGTKFKVGLDPLIGLIPVVGDIVTFAISAIIVVSFARHGASAKLVLKMLLNIVAELVIGGIPVLGDIWDFFFKANMRNLQLLIDHHEKKLDQG